MGATIQQQPIQPQVPSPNGGDEAIAPGAGQPKPAEGREAVLAQADQLLAEGANALGLKAPPMKNHDDRVRVVAEIHGALQAKDPRAAEAFLQQLETVGKPLALNFGLKHREANGSLGAVLNADAFKRLDATYKQQHEALYAEFAASGAPTPDATTAADESRAAADFSKIDVDKVMKALRPNEKGEVTVKQAEQALNGGGLSQPEQQALLAFAEQGGQPPWKADPIETFLNSLKNQQPAQP